MRRIMSIFLIVVMIVSCLGIPSFADSGSYFYKDRRNNNTVETTIKGTWKNNATNGNVWFTEKGEFSGTSTTYWWGSTPFYADNITHTNKVYCDKLLGNFSVSVNSSGSLGGSVSVSAASEEVAYTYSVSNEWVLRVNYVYSYKISLHLRATTGIKASATIQCGATFYMTDTGY